MRSLHPTSDTDDEALSEPSSTSPAAGFDSGHGVRAQDENRSTPSPCRRINDAVYEMYVPSTPASMDILFFHGLQLQGSGKLDAHLLTWRSRGPDGSQSIWPKEWLPKDFPSARILTISYDGSKKKTSEDGLMDMQIVAENLLQNLLLAKVGQGLPVILIGHSFGGLVIKKLCLLADESLHRRSHRPEREVRPTATFLANIRGIFYYATPHQGMQFTDVIDLDSEEGELMNFVKIFNKDLARLNQDFQNLRFIHVHWQIAALGETMPTDLGGGLCELIVKEASARCENFTAVRAEDHFSICQPREKNNTTYQLLVSFIHNVEIQVEENKRQDIFMFPNNRQPLPTIHVGLLSSSAGELLQRLEKCRVVGLWGMGGIGKTTLSKLVFNHLHSNFEYTMFAENVKEISGSEEELERKLLEQLHQNGKKMQTTDSTISMIYHLRGKEILVVLDDVDTARDVAIVSKIHDFCSAKSRVMLTSRDRLILSKVDEINIYEVELLAEESSEVLFRSFAISPGDKVLPKWQQNCLFRIVSLCGGLPLVLKVLGLYLNDTDSQEVWEQTAVDLVNVEKVNSVGIDEAWSKLEISYKSLEDAEKKMFIDAATFFQDKIVQSDGYKRRMWTLREAKAAWRIANNNGETESLHWRRLVDRALVYNVADDSEIKMHEQLKYLGQKLAEGTKENRRIKSTDVGSLSKILHNNFQIEAFFTSNE